jgi:membrane protein implicated in regulation of membrane protease activity
LKGDDIILYWYYIIAFAVLIVIEITTYNLLTIWLAIAALLTSIYAFFFPTQVLPQLFIFLVLSITLLALTKPIVKKLKIGKHPTNADRLIGMDGIVIEEINAILGTGQIKINNQIWSAKSESLAIIPKDQIVKIIKIEGVKLVCH